jgi:hypothetical protein
VVACARHNAPMERAGCQAHSTQVALAAHSPNTHTPSPKHTHTALHTSTFNTTPYISNTGPKHCRPTANQLTSQHHTLHIQQHTATVLREEKQVILTKCITCVSTQASDQVRQWQMPCRSPNAQPTNSTHELNNGPHMQSHVADCSMVVDAAHGKSPSVPEHSKHWHARSNQVALRAVTLVPANYIHAKVCFISPAPTDNHPAGDNSSKHTTGVCRPGCTEQPAGTYDPDVSSNNYQ